MAFDSELLKKLKLGLSDDRQHLVIRSAIGREEASEYSFGIEEEYFLADKRTLNVAIETPNELFEAANWSTGGQAMREMLQSQLEVASNVHVDVRDAREEMCFLRREVAKVADEYGFAIMACGTHPTAVWRLSQPSPKPRYEEKEKAPRQVAMFCIAKHGSLAASAPSVIAQQAITASFNSLSGEWHARLAKCGQCLLPERKLRAPAPAGTNARSL